MSALTDLIKLSQRTGKIPASVPAHYVKWALSTHRNERKLKRK